MVGVIVIRGLCAIWSHCVMFMGKVLFCTASPSTLKYRVVKNSWQPAKSPPTSYFWPATLLGYSSDF